VALRVLIFDLDETLLANEAVATAALLATGELARLRHGVDPVRLQRAVRRRARELWRAAPSISYCQALGISSWEGLRSTFPGQGPELAWLRAWAPAYRRGAWQTALADCGIDDLALAQELAERFPRERAAREVVFPDVQPVLRQLRASYRLGLVSNGPSDVQRAKLATSGLAAFFEVVLISTEVGVGKPDPRIFAGALAGLGAAPHEAVMVGDSLERDVAGAQAAGLQAIWLNRSGQPCPTGLAPALQIARLEELAQALPLTCAHCG
jgi:putative hydrolase of the HAD superfamily